MKNLMLSLLLTFSSMPVLAASPTPGPLFTYEGILTDAAGTPINTTQTVQLQILYPAACVVFEETHSITPGPNGEFSVIVGSGTRTDSTGNNADRIFASSGTVTCTDTSTASVAGFTTRSLRVRVGGTTLTPDIAINTVPFAINAARLNDKSSTDFVQVNAASTQSNIDSVFGRYGVLDSILNLFATAPTNGQLLIGTGTGYSAATLTAGSGVTISNGPGSITISASGGSGTITSVTAQTPLGVAGTAAVPDLFITQATSSTPGYLSSADWQTFNGKQDKNLTAGSIWVGDAAGKASPVSVTGDATMDAYGALNLINVGTPGTFVKVTVDAQGRVTSGAVLAATDIPNLNWSKITAGLPTTLAGYGITDALNKTGDTMTGSLNLNNNDLLSAGHIVMGAQKTFKLGNYTTAQEVTLTNGLGPTHAGYFWFNITNNEIKYWNGTTAVTLGAAGGGATIPVNLATEVTGTLPIANGGTGSTTSTGAFAALSPLTIRGDLLTYDGTSNIRLPAGSNGQVLSSASSEVSGLKWITPPGGTVTSVNGIPPLVIANSTTTPTISVNDATTTTKGVVQIGNGLGVTAGTISVDPNSFPSVVPISKGGTGTNSLTANRIVATNGSASALTVFGCTMGQMISFDALGNMGCSTFTSLGLILNTGNTLGSPMTIGTNDSYSVSLKTKGITRMTVSDAGQVAIGDNANPGKLNVTGTGEVARFTSTSTGGISIETDLNMAPYLYFKKGGLDRWSLSANALPESGSDSGSNFNILRYSDAGTMLGPVVTINRLNGFFGINTTAPAYNLHVDGSAGLTTGTAWTVASDARLKDIQAHYEYGLNEILKLHTVRYTYKANNPANMPSDVPMIGFIAQDVQQVIPDAVKTRADGYLELNVDPIHWATVNAVQELHGLCKASDEQLQKTNRRVASLEEDAAAKDLRIQALEKENQNLKKDLEMIKAKLGLK